ncbi:hypothetical protein ACMHYB_40115 [Sorangium sp. So ce1128]
MEHERSIDATGVAPGAPEDLSAQPGQGGRQREPPAAPAAAPLDMRAVADRSASEAAAGCKGGHVCMAVADPSGWGVCLSLA